MDAPANQNAKPASKDTRIHLVEELEKLTKLHTISFETRKTLLAMIEEAKAGEYHDYKNQKYDCGKVAAAGYLRKLGFIPLAKRIEEGEFDEDADADDQAMIAQLLAQSAGENVKHVGKLFEEFRRKLWPHLPKGSMQLDVIEQTYYCSWLDALTFFREIIGGDAVTMEKGVALMQGLQVEVETWIKADIVKANARIAELEKIKAAGASTPSSGES